MAKKIEPPMPIYALASWKRTAPIAFLALLDIAIERKSMFFRISLEELSLRTGIERRDTLSSMLTALEQNRWIERRHTYIKGAGHPLRQIQIKILKYGKSLKV